MLAGIKIFLIYGGVYLVAHVHVNNCVCECFGWLRWYFLKFHIFWQVRHLLKKGKVTPAFISCRRNARS